MSQDLMQALSGSSILSLSIGTLPAGKQGMSLDANPFASQLALMTGADAAVGGALAPDTDALATGAGAFAAALSELAVPVSRDAAVPAPVAGNVAPSQPATAAPNMLSVLPDDASATQLIEAVLTDAAELIAPVIAAPVADRTPVADKALPVASDPSLPAPQPAVSQPTAPLTLLPRDASVVRPVDAIDASMPAEAVLKPEPATAIAEEVGTLPAETLPPHRRAKADATALVADVLPPVAAPLAPVQLPVADTDVPETDLGTTRIATEAALQAPRRTALDAAVAMPTQRGAVPPAEGVDTAPLAQQPRNGSENAADTITAPIAPAVEVAANPAPQVATEARISGTRVATATPAQLSPAPPSPVVAETADTPIATAPMNLATPEPLAAPQAASQTNATVPAATPVVPAPIEADMPPAPALAAAAQPVVQQVQAQQVHAQQVHASAAPRTSAVAPRTTFTPAARRAIDAAVQSSRPAEALSALFAETEVDLDPVASISRAESGSTSSLGAVPPPWALALNAVNSASLPIPGLTVPLASGNGDTAPAESLAFDTSFVANIETQIARVANGDQLVRMQIIPENMGRIEIEMLAGPERDQIRIVTEHDAVRDTLVSSQHRLEQDLRSNAQRPTDVTVELRQQSPGTQNGSAQQQQQRGQSGAEATAAREAAQRQTAADTTADPSPAARRPRGNVRYA